MRPKLSAATQPRASAIGLVAAALLASLGLSSCSVLPDRRCSPSQEREVVAHYRFPRGGGAPVRVPASRPGLTVLALRTDPPNLRETFSGGERYLMPTGGNLKIHCRYRVTQAAGEYPTPTDLFPGATTIDTVSQPPD